MSATNRGERGGGARDFFPTPSWCVHRYLDDVAELLPGGHWLEPAVGGSAIVQAVNGWKSSHGKRAPKWVTVDIAEGTGADLVADFTAFDCPELCVIAPPKRFTVAITNPPYNVAMDFIRSAMAWAPIVAMLLRVNFLGSQDRAAFMRANPPRIDVLPDRPQFDLEKEGTDATEYAWLTWGLPPVVNVLKTTPQDVRLADRRRARFMTPDPRQEGLFDETTG